MDRVAWHAAFRGVTMSQTGTCNWSEGMSQGSVLSLLVDIWFCIICWLNYTAALVHDLSVHVWVYFWIVFCFYYMLSPSIVSDSLRPHGLQHARLPCPSSFPEFSQIHVHCVCDAIQPSCPLLSPSPPAFDLSQHQCLFQWVGSLHQVAKVLEL